MSSSRMDKLCRSVLPSGYQRMARLGPDIEQFLQQNLPEPINKNVTLLNIDDEQIVIAANTPVMANYLRLHATEIQQQLRETFQLNQTVKFRSVPDTLLKPAPQSEKLKPVRASQQSIDSLKRSAQWVEDEQLNSALLSLADSMKSD